MTITSPVENTVKLRSIVRADAAMSFGFAVLLIVAAGPLGRFLGVATAVPLVIGIGLLPWVAFLWRAAHAERPAPEATWMIIGGNLAWALAAVVVLVATDWLSTGGRWAFAIVSLLVLDFGLAEWWALRRSG